MTTYRWPGTVTEDGKHFLADEMRAFKACLAQFAGRDVEIVVRVKPRRQSPRKRGFYHSALKPAFRAWLELQVRDHVEAFREHYGEFTLDAAHDVLVRAVLNLPEDVERVSTALDAMDDARYEDFLFRVTGFLVRLGVDFDDAERDPVVRFERATRQQQRSSAA